MRKFKNILARAALGTVLKNKSVSELWQSNKSLFKILRNSLKNRFKLFLDFRTPFFAEHLLTTGSVFGACLSEIYATRGRSRAAASPKTRLFVNIVNGCC